MIKSNAHTTCDHLVQNWIVRKRCVQTTEGIVVSQSRIAAQAGASSLRANGNAIDAAITTAAALAALEPWNSGLGGTGFMVVYIAKEDRALVIDGGPIAPRRLNPADYPLSGKTGGDLFNWPMVIGDRNVMGPLSIAVPGLVDGWGLAHRNFGTKPWAELLAPAVEFAEQGLPVDWWTTLKITANARELNRFKPARSIYLPDDLPAYTPSGAAPTHLRLVGLDKTLKRLAAAGARDFYEGELACDLIADFEVSGAIITGEDLASYHARMVEPLEVDYRDTRLALAPGLTAGPSLARALSLLPRAGFKSREPDAAAYVAYVEALKSVYAERLAHMGESEAAPGSTTHLSVVDRDGNMVALTQTLLSSFGSKVVLPKTGVLMNNGVMWFDPRPGWSNSLGPGKRPLTNMCPAIVRNNRKGWFAIGASGGRKILPAVLQMISFLVDFRLTLEAAAHQPRVDASGGEVVTADPRLSAEVRSALAKRFTLRLGEHTTYPANYACPQVVLQDPVTGVRFGIGDVMSPWSGAVAATKTDASCNLE